MSVALMAEVWRRECGQLQGLLLALADHADDDGTRVYPSVAHTAWKVERDRRTIQRQLRTLQQMGVLIEEERATQHRSTRYRLNLAALPLKEPFVPQGRHGVAPVPEAASVLPEAASDTSRGGAGAALTIKEPPVEPSGSSLARSSIVDRFFDAFWEAYPRRSGKLKAREAFGKALQREGVTPPLILEGARAYRDDPNREPEFTKHPTTWLNQGCWDDDPLPARADAKGVSAEQMAQRARRSGSAQDESGPVGVRGFMDALVQATEGEHDEEAAGRSLGGDHQSGVSEPADAGGDSSLARDAAARD